MSTWFLDSELSNCFITISSSNSTNSVSVSNSPVNSITTSSLDSGNSIVVNGNSAHSYGSSIFTTRILPNTLPPKSICQPYKKCKEDGNNDVTVVTSANKTWLQAGSHKLTLHDQMTLINGNELSDRHINFTQYLLLNQFPSIKGFRLTLLQEKPLTAR